MEEHYLQKLSFLLAWLHSKINNIFDVHWCLPTFFFIFINCTDWNIEIRFFKKNLDLTLK